MFFGPIVALIVLTINHYRKQIKIWWFLHNRKVALKNKAREPGQQRRMAYDANHKVVISEPIPLNQQNNANRPFYQPIIDPWAETSCGASKSSDYRLNPLDNQLDHQIPSGHVQPNSTDVDRNDLKPGL